ncbi:hypothetical protein [Aestuariibaculum marinum]|uniref:Lipoprotein n=1 Tax=Aestuariibaculum marinum TaxID=2683592 RepID=A0A8J6UCR3_9FLAO|nr:hypothetical protein [Aestuariibaculum marinum]MBD0825193.1 hypothetical protein [Aestuariibaculum marinum]
MKTKFNILFVLASLFFNFSCSDDNNNDSNEPCEDYYELYTYYCNTSTFEGFHTLNLKEGERINNIINSSSETCFIITGVDWKGDSFNGYVGSDTFSKLTFVDCSKRWGTN